VAVGVFLVLLAPLLVFAQAEQDFYGERLPRYEAGLAIGGFRIPEYPGSNENRTIVLPLPFFVYRGDVVRADRGGGLRGRFFRSDRLEFDVSFGAAFPANSQDNEARRDMQDIDWIGEVGPRIRYFVIKTPLVRMDLNFAARHVFSTNFHSRWNNQGLVLNPEIQFRHRALFDDATTFVAALDFRTASKELMEYLFEVSERDVTPTRPRYEAEAGYFGTGLTLFAVKAFQNRRLNLFTGVSFANYDGARNLDSPLLRDRSTTSLFFGLSYTFFVSKEMTRPEVNQ
jgi:MipA family protein